MLEREEKVVRLMVKRAYLSTCSFQTVWEQMMTEREKDGFTYDYILLDYMANS